MTTVDSNELENLLRLKTPSVGERATKFLVELVRRHPNVGDTFEFSFPDDVEADWLAVTWSARKDEVQYLALEYLQKAVGAIDGNLAPHMQGVHLMEAYITPRGHQILEEMREANPDSAIGFCAMWFSDDVAPLWTEAIEPAIRAAGYEPKRIDQHEHVNRIDDEIVATIRRSRFVVADFTGQRGGVYFEAGYALGLGLRVVWLCRTDELNAVHFDTRQYNFLLWQAGQYADLAKRLQNRIEATLGRGPLLGSTVGGS